MATGKADVIDRRTLIRQLIDIHYVRNDLVLEAPNLLIRGGMMEIYPA